MSNIYDDMFVLLRSIDWFEDQRIFEDGLPEQPIEAACVSVIGGVIERIHNKKGKAWTNYGIQVRVRSAYPRNARERIYAAADRMDGVVNTQINGTMYRSIFQIDPPVLLERDPGGETVYGVSFNVTRRE